MLDLVVVDGHAKGIVVRDLSTGEITSHAADAVILATGGYGNVFFLSTNAMGCNVTAALRANKRGAYMANPCFTQIHPTCIPVSGDYQSKLTLMSESLRNDGRIWVPKTKEDAAKIRAGEWTAKDIPEEARDYFLERKYPSFGNLAPRDISSRSAKEVCDEGRGVAKTGLGVYLDFSDATQRLGKDTIKERYGNLFQMYEKISGEDPYEFQMKIYPAVHYTMGGLWVDYNLMSNIPGLHVIGEANFSDHGANRLGASALMQGLADGYFVIPSTLPNYLAGQKPGSVTTDAPEFKQVETEVKERIQKLMTVKGTKSVDSFHRELGMLVWDECGMARTREGLLEALEKIPKIRENFWKDVIVPGSAAGTNMELEKAWRVADFIDFAEIMCHDALDREESCGGHFREEFQFTSEDEDVKNGYTNAGEAMRRDDEFCYVAAWEFKGEGVPPVLHKEALEYEAVELSVRSYK
jgi:succinate dehydrogenase / fumarate reductase flavoprotein subunit